MSKRRLTPCPYCARGMWRDRTEHHCDRWPTIEHVVPVSRGGADDPANVTLVCRECNELKADLLLSEWLRYLDRDGDDRAIHVRVFLSSRPDLRQAEGRASPWCRDEVRAMGVEAVRRGLEMRL